MKRCTTCGEEKPLTEFWKRAVSPDGHYARCKPCAKAYHKAHYRKHRDKKIARARDHRERNPEVVKATQDRYREKNREQIRERRQREREEAPEVWAAQRMRWREGYREKAREAQQRFRQTPYGRAARADDRLARRAKTKNRIDRLIILERADGACGICGGDVDPFSFHVDHIIPLSRGGEHTYENVQPAHPFCNQTKWAHLPEEVTYA